MERVPRITNIAEATPIRESLEFGIRIPKDNKSDRQFLMDKWSTRLRELSGQEISANPVLRDQSDPDSKDGIILKVEFNHAATAEEIQAFALAAYRLLTELQKEKFEPDLSYWRGTNPLISEEGFVTPITYESDAKDQSRYKHFQMAAISRQLGPVMEFASSIHYQRIKPDDSPLTIHDFLQNAGQNKAALVAAYEPRPVFAPQLSRARNFIFGGLAGSLLGAAAISLAFLLLPPPLSFAVAGVGAILLVAGLVTIGINFMQARTFNKQLKTCLDQMSKASADGEPTLSAVSLAQQLGPGSSATDSARLEPSAPSPFSASLASVSVDQDKLTPEKCDVMIRALQIGQDGSASLASMPAVAKRQLEAIITAHKTNLEKLLADNSEELQSYREQAQTLLAWYTTQGVELAKPAGPSI